MGSPVLSGDSLESKLESPEAPWMIADRLDDLEEFGRIQMALDRDYPYVLEAYERERGGVNREAGARASSVPKTLKAEIPKTLKP
jgi:hypothetical protein